MYWASRAVTSDPAVASWAMAARSSPDAPIVALQGGVHVGEAGRGAARRTCANSQVLRATHRLKTGSVVTGLTMSAGPMRSGSMIGGRLRWARAACHWLRWPALARHSGSLALRAIQYVRPVRLSPPAIAGRAASSSPRP